METKRQTRSLPRPASKTRASTQRTAERAFSLRAFPKQNEFRRIRDIDATLSPFWAWRMRYH